MGIWVDGLMVMVFWLEVEVLRGEEEKWDCGWWGQCPLSER